MPSLEDLLLADDDDDVRAWAEAALKQRAPVAAVPAHVPKPTQKAAAAELFDDEDDEVRAWAEAALGGRTSAAGPGRVAAQSPIKPHQTVQGGGKRAPAAPWQQQPRQQSDSSAAELLAADDDEEVRAWAAAALGQSRAQAAPVAAPEPPSGSGRSPSGVRGSSRGSVREHGGRSSLELLQMGSHGVEQLTEEPEDEAQNVISVCVRLRGLNTAERPGGMAWKTEGGLIWETEAEAEAEQTGRDLTAYEFPKLFTPAATQARAT